MGKQVLKSDRAPKAIGPYSQAIRAGGFIFVSGQVPADPVSGEVVSDDVAVQTERVLNNIKNILSDSGATLADVVKTTIFLTDMNDFQTVNKVYSKFFPQDPPARSTVQVVRLPRDVRVEIESIAWTES